MTGNQRWRERKAFFRRPDEQIRPADYEVGPVDTPAAKQFILTHHYAGSYPAARFRFGLYRHGQLVGVAIFSHPMNDKTLTNLFDGTPTDSVELGRFILLDEVPGNGETWFLARCLQVLRRRGLRGVVSFSDPTPRLTFDGRTVFPGHVGTIYQAANARFLGRGKARQLLLLPDGTVLSERVISKIRNGEQGRVYGCRLLQSHGASNPAITVGWLHRDYQGWLDYWLPLLTRPLRHPGNFKYAWALTESVSVPPSLPYPKKATG